jgi:CTP synthase
MQTAVIEFARNVLGYKDADSSEFAPQSKHPVIDLMPDQHGVKMGGTMRLGAYPCVVLGKHMKEAYGTDMISERHRHRYEFNNDFRDEIQKAGMVIAGTSPNGLLVEAVEIPSNDFYLGVQFHPEFKSRPQAAHPVFREFVKFAVKYNSKK